MYSSATDLGYVAFSLLCLVFFNIIIALSLSNLPANGQYAIIKHLHIFSLPRTDLDALVLMVCSCTKVLFAEYVCDFYLLQCLRQMSVI